MTHHHHNPIRDHLRSLLASRRAIFHAQVIIHDIINIPLVQGDLSVRWRFDNAQAVQPGDNPLKLKKKEEETSTGTVDDSLDGRMTISSSSSADLSSDTGNHLIAPRHGTNDPTYGQYLSPEITTTPQTPLDEDTEIPENFLSSSRGKTEWCPLLHDHSVIFNQRIDVELEMGIDRETKDLHPCELKLEVLLELPKSDAKERGKESFGVVYIDLAQYAQAGAETRRHLLQKSKTNAIMRVSIELTQIGGDHNFIAPTLPSAQLLSGLAGLLDREQTLVSQVNLETRGRMSSSDSSSIDSPPRPSMFSRSMSKRGGKEALTPSASTESIINALFNPYPAPASSQTPFTFVAPSRSATSTPSSLSRSDSAASDHFSARRPSDVGSYGFLRPLTKRDPSPARRTNSMDPSEKKGKWWKLGSSSSRPMTPGSDREGASPALQTRSAVRVKDFARPNDATIRKPPAIAITNADQS